MKVHLGKKVKFTPWMYLNRDGDARWVEPRPVIGVIVSVNVPHKYFVAEYSKSEETFRECFKFSQVGKDVTVLG